MLKLNDDSCSSNDSVSACDLNVGGTNADTDADTFHGFLLQQVLL